MNINDTVTVIAKENSHEFEIGQKVQIIDKREDDIFCCRSLNNPNVVWWLTDKEIK